MPSIDHLLIDDPQLFDDPQPFDDPQLFDDQLEVWTLIIQKSTVIPPSLQCTDGLVYEQDNIYRTICECVIRIPYEQVLQHS